MGALALPTYELQPVPEAPLAAPRPPAEPPASYGRIADQRLAFVLAAAALVRRGWSHQLACREVAGRQDWEISTSYQTYNRYRKALREAKAYGPGGIVLEGRARQALMPDWTHGTREQTGHPEFWRHYFTALLTEHQIDMRVAWRDTATWFRLTHPLHRPEEIPSYQTVRRWTKQHVSEEVMIYAREGEDVFSQRAEGYISRDWSNVAPGECWFGDHHKLDVYCRVPDGKGGWVGSRVWLTAWMDAKSLYVLPGYMLYPGKEEEPSHVAILEALIKGTIANGNRPPQTLYIDNGKDYLKQGFIVPKRLLGRDWSICLALGGIDPRRAIRYRARSKVIERIFGEVCRRFARWFRSYCGNRPGACPEATSELWKKEPEKLPTLDEIKAVFAMWLARDWHAQGGEYSEITGGRPPAEMWARRQVLRPALTNDELVQACLMPVEAKVVRRGRQIELQNPYEPAATRTERLYLADALRVGDQVVVKVNVFGGDRIWCYDPNGRLRCVATRKERVDALHATPEEFAREAGRNSMIRAQAREEYRQLTGQRKPGLPQGDGPTGLLAGGEPVPAPVLPDVLLPGTPEHRPRLRLLGDAAARRAEAEAAQTGPTSLVDRLLAEVSHDAVEEVLRARHAAGPEAPLLDQVLNQP